MVIVHVGSCDFLSLDLNDVENNYKNYVELLTAVSDKCPSAQLLICSVLPRNGKAQRQINEQIDNFNTKLALLACDEDNITFLDNNVHFTDETGVIESLYKKKDRSGVHINDDGKMRLEASLQDALKETIFKCKLEAEFVKV